MSGVSDPARGIRFVLMAVALFAVQDGISKHLAQSYPVPFFVMIRYWFFAAFVIAMAVRSPGGIRGAWRTKMPLTQVFRGVLLVFQIWVIVTSFDLIGLGPTHAIFALHPLVATLMAIPLLGEMVGWRRLAAVGVGFLGILVILRPGAGVFDPYALIAVGSSFLFGFYSVLTRMVAKADGSARPAFFYTGVAGAVAVTAVGPFFWTPMLPADWAWLGVLCVTGMAGHYCLIRALDATEAVRIQPFIYLQMVFATAMGWTLFGEPFDPVALIGMAMIVGAGLYAIWREWVAMERAKVAARAAREGGPG
ncbi:DMT family transporter [Limibaculum sp. FT325]|uniref:DMT family transporter n=1 Tax=Thermohalobaculum sediminis TaxID=2939436 RepID=UPI0020BD781C|nr:DMT family transporter [Limibaculum sediminis]MCL5776014.1 DMT family transporter [Limibaculum sediminis]